jgi:CRP/FNR family transcriptional regulator, cyclic AMP receptor protein
LRKANSIRGLQAGYSPAVSMYRLNVRENLTPDRHRSDERRANRQAAALAAALANVSLFSECTKRELRLIAKFAHTRQVREGTQLTVEGESGDDMFVLLTGSAVVQRGGRKLASVGSGDAVGELAILSKAPRNATVTTTADAEIAVISRRHVRRMIEEAPGFSLKLLEALANRVRDLDRKLVC